MYCVAGDAKSGWRSWGRGRVGRGKRTGQAAVSVRPVDAECGRGLEHSRARRDDSNPSRRPTASGGERRARFRSVFVGNPHRKPAAASLPFCQLVGVKTCRDACACGFCTAVPPPNRNCKQQIRGQYVRRAAHVGREWERQRFPGEICRNTHPHSRNARRPHIRPCRIIASPFHAPARPEGRAVRVLRGYLCVCFNSGYPVPRPGICDFFRTLFRSTEADGLPGNKGEKLRRKQQPQPPIFQRMQIPPCAPQRDAHVPEHANHASPCSACVRAFLAASRARCFRPPECR